MTPIENLRNLIHLAQNYKPKQINQSDDDYINQNKKLVLSLLNIAPEIVSKYIHYCIYPNENPILKNIDHYVPDYAKIKNNSGHLNIK
ncbi:MAG: hypothetical protein AABY32_01785 [Nanoarchaeota archaeon]